MEFRHVTLWAVTFFAGFTFYLFLSWFAKLSYISWPAGTGRREEKDKRPKLCIDSWSKPAAKQRKPVTAGSQWKRNDHSKKRWSYPRSREETPRPGNVGDSDFRNMRCCTYVFTHFLFESLAWWPTKICTSVCCWVARDVSFYKIAPKCMKIHVDRHLSL